MWGYVASCGRLMVEWGRPRGRPHETLGTPKWTLIGKKQCKLDVTEKCLEDSARHLLKLEGAAAKTNVTFES